MKMDEPKIICIHFTSEITFCLKKQVIFQSRKQRGKHGQASRQKDVCKFAFQKTKKQITGPIEKRGSGVHNSLLPE